MMFNFISPAGASGVRSFNPARPRHWRLPNVPDVPTASESGVPGYVAENWWGLAAPKGTPQAAIDAIHAAVKAALQNEAVAKKLADLGFLPGGETPAQFAKAAKSEAEIWRETACGGLTSVLVWPGAADLLQLGED